VRRKSSWLGLNKKLIGQGVKWIYICILVRILEKASSINSGMPLRQAKKLYPIPILYALKLAFHAGPSIGLAIEIDHIDLLNGLPV